MKSLFVAAFLWSLSIATFAQKATVVLYDPCGLGKNQGIALKGASNCVQLPFKGIEASRKVRTGAFQIELNLADGFVVMDDCGDQVMEGTEIFLSQSQIVCFEIGQLKN